MKKSISILVIMALMISCLFAVSFTANATVESNHSIKSVAPDEFSAVIMSVKDSVDRGKIIDYFCAPAYEQSEALDVSNADESEPLNTPEKDAQLLSEAKQLVKLSGEALDKKIAELAQKNAPEIIAKDSVTVTKEYLAFAEDNFNRKTVNAIEKMSLSTDTKIGVVLGDTDSKQLAASTKAAATKTNKKQMYKTYGSKSGGAYCKFWTTVTWKTKSGKITSITSTTPKPTTPAYITPTSAKRNKTSGRNLTTGLVQKAWGYVNLLYGDGKITGYYIIDGKVFGNNKNRYKGATLSPAQYNKYKWGNV